MLVPYIPYRLSWIPAVVFFSEVEAWISNIKSNSVSEGIIVSCAKSYKAERVCYFAGSFSDIFSLTHGAIVCCCVSNSTWPLHDGLHENKQMASGRQTLNEMENCED